MYHDSKNSLDLNDAYMSSIRVPSQSVACPVSITCFSMRTLRWILFTCTFTIMSIFLAPLRFSPPSRYEVLVALKAFVIHKVHSTVRTWQKDHLGVHHIWPEIHIVFPCLSWQLIYIDPAHLLAPVLCPSQLIVGQLGNFYSQANMYSVYLPCIYISESR